MSKRLDWDIVFYYRKTGRYAHNALAACVQQRLEQDQFECHLHFPKTIEQLNAHINRSKHRNIIVLWSFYSPDAIAVKEELAQIKVPDSIHQIIHIAGGVHASAQPLQTLELGFDYVAVGEGESIIDEISLAVMNNSDFNQIKGLHYFDNQQYIRNGKGKIVQLDNYPPCSIKFKRMGPIEITRGCIYACQFCQTPFFNKARFRHRSIDNIAYHATRMHGAGFRDFRFVTPTAFSYGSYDDTVNMDAIEALLAKIREIIARRGRLFYGSFPSEIRPEHVSHSHLNTLKKYVDNDNIIIGGQSGSDAMLVHSHRGHTVDDIIRAVEISLKCGFKPNVDFLYGMPGEQLQDIEATLALANKLATMGARIHSHSFMPLPGTPFQDYAPEPLPDKIIQQINHLHSSGLAYGQWQAQQAIAQTILDSKTSKSTSVDS